MSFTDVDLARLLIALAVLLLAAHGVGALFAKFKQPPAIGEIVGGILLGPSALGAALPSVQHWIFPSTGSSAAALGAVYQIGLLLLRCLLLVLRRADFCSAMPSGPSRSPRHSAWSYPSLLASAWWRPWAFAVSWVPRATSRRWFWFSAWR